VTFEPLECTSSGSVAGLDARRGLLECEFCRYEPVTGEIPERPRTDDNPLDRKEYLLRVTRRL
jgi:ribosomal protection tetracycline resistance protein